MNEFYMLNKLPEMKHADVNTLPCQKSATSLATNFGKREEVNVDGITMPKSWRTTTMRGNKKRDFSLSCADYQKNRAQLSPGPSK